MTNDHDGTQLPQVCEALSREHDKSVRHSLRLDVEYYKELLDDPALGDVEKEQIITALWQIIVAFVELGFNVHPSQQACGKGRTKQDRTSKFGTDALEYSQPVRASENVDAPEP